MRTPCPDEALAHGVRGLLLSKRRDVNFEAGATWIVAIAAVIGMLFCPWRSKEWMWAFAGGVALVVIGAVPIAVAGTTIGHGTNVYAFLIGVMALAELAREESIFTRLAGMAFDVARGSQGRLFLLIYVVGALVTMFLANDTTAVVLTPAVLAILRETDADPLPYLYACAFVANAASYLLPISNPANLVYFGITLPRLGAWIERFGISALGAIVVVYITLHLSHIHVLRRPYIRTKTAPPLSATGRVSAVAVAISVAVLIAAAALGIPVGPIAFICAAAALIVVGSRDHRLPEMVVRHVSWQTIPLVAGLFLIAAALERTGSLQAARHFITAAGGAHATIANLKIGGAAALAANLFNNLFVSTAGGQTIAHQAFANHLIDAGLVGIDLGPNLFVSGSLATLLWLAALNREGVSVTPLQFFKLGAVVILPALAVAEVLIR